MIALDAVMPLSKIPTKPLKMRKGGDPEKKLAEGPPEDINMLPRFEGFEAGPNQFELPEEEAVIPSEPNVRSVPGADRMTEGMGLEERMFNTPTIDPREVYPRDPDPFIQGFFDPMPQSTGGIPNLLQANMLKPLGILSINKTYNI